MFELNLASLPNHILYLEGVQLSYIKVFVHIFNLWHSDKTCFLSNPELCKRTGLHKTTVIDAINFFEKNNVLKRVKKNGRRYLVQVARAVETESEDVDNLENDRLNNEHRSELDYLKVGASLPKRSSNSYHNNKYNNKTNKSFCVSREDQKKDNSKKHDFAERKEKPVMTDVTKQSTSYNPNSVGRQKKASNILEEYMSKNPLHQEQTGLKLMG